MKSYKQMVNEVLTKSTPAGEWIKDFVGSDNPKFAGKSTAKRKQMALAAYYSKQEESYAGSQNSTAVTDMNEDHLVHVSDGSGYDETPHEKDIQHIQAGAMHTGGQWHSYSGKGAFFKFKSKEDAEQFKRHVDKCPHKSCYADHVNEAVEYKGIGTDVVDKKKKLNPQPNFTMAKKQVKDFKEEKDNREYGYEGDMAVSQLKTIIRHSEHLMGMLKPDTDLPEWVQSKITLATDYMQTAHDYLMSEMNEEVEQIDEVSKSTLMRYIPKASRDVADNVAMAKERQVTMVHATHAGNYDMANKESDKSKVSFKKAMQRIKGIDTATKKLGTQKEETEQIDELSKGLVARYANKVAKTTQDNYDKSKDKFQFSSSRQDGMKNAVKRLTKEEVELDEAIAKKLPVQHAVDAVHATLGPKSATRFLSHLSPGTDKHTSWDKVNDALVKQGVQTHHIASIAQKTSHANVNESRGHKVLASFFKNREVAQRAYQGNPAKDAEVAQGGGSPADQGIAAAKRDAEELKKKVNEVKAPAVRAAPPKKTKSTAKEYASASIPGTKRVASSKPDDNEVGGGTATRIAEDQYTSEYKIKSYVDPATGENKTRKIRPHRINFKSSKMNAAPAQMTEPTKVTEDDKVYDEKWKKYKGKTFKKESTC